MKPPPRRAIVVFDGDCALCNGFVAWLIRNDRRGAFLIAGSAGAVGKAAIAAAGLDESIAASTLVVWDGRAFVRSRAVARVASGLAWPWRGAATLRAVPRPLADAVYRAVATRRPRVIADDPACGIPPADLVERWRERLATLADVEAQRGA